MFLLPLTGVRSQDPPVFSFSCRGDVKLRNLLMPVTSAPPWYSVQTSGSTHQLSVILSPVSYHNHLIQAFQHLPLPLLSQDVIYHCSPGDPTTFKSTNCLIIHSSAKVKPFDILLPSLRKTNPASWDITFCCLCDYWGEEFLQAICLISLICHQLPSPCSQCSLSALHPPLFHVFPYFFPFLFYLSCQCSSHIPFLFFYQCAFSHQAL